MKKKFDLSRHILAGIATADFDVENAQAMRNLSKVEDFIRGQTPGYHTQLQVFDEAAAEIARQAQKGKVDGVALFYAAND